MGRYSGSNTLIQFRAEIDTLSGTSYPYCSSRFVEYGYGLGTFVDVDCYNSKLGELTTTVKNPSWRLYATVTNPAKGPPPSISYSSYEPSSSADISSSSTLPTSTAAPRGEKQGISTGAIAGITVGGIVAIAVCVGAIMAIRHFMRKPQQPQEGMVQQGGMGYVQQPPQPQVGYGQQGGMEQQHGGVYVPQQGGTGKEAELEQPAVYTQQGQQGYSTLQSPQDPLPEVYQLP